MGFEATPQQALAIHRELFDTVLRPRELTGGDRNRARTAE
jgi:hypothetical protein